MASIIDINTASRTMLCKLNGVGGGFADVILASRPFLSWEDCTRKLGLDAEKGANFLRKIQDPSAKVSASLFPVGANTQPDGPLEDDLSDHSEPDSSEHEESDSEEISAKLIARWEKKKVFFVQFRHEGRFSDRAYYDFEQDQACAKEYYASIGSSPNYWNLSELLQRKRHGGRSKVMFPLFDRHPDGTLKCIYSGRELSDREGNLVLKCDEEHSVPQSWQAIKTAHTGRDIHQMFAAWKSANGSRGNRPFGVGEALVDESQFGKCYSLTGLAKTMFVPNINQGPVARATLYILVAYPKALKREYVPEASLKWLVEAATQEPTLWEKHRNAVGHEHQGNRNPFIDHPEWARLIDFSQGLAD